MGRLSMSRRPGERIVLQVPGYDAIWIALGSIKNSRIQISIDAPNAVRIWREEVLEQQQERSPPKEDR